VVETRVCKIGITLTLLNRLTPNDPYMGRTAPQTSKCCILYIYSTNIGTEYFKRALYSPFFFSLKCSLFHNANLFGSCIIHILYTGCAKIKKNNSGGKGLIKYSSRFYVAFSMYTFKVQAKKKKLKGVLKKPNFCYKDPIAHFTAF
jgi:hypothetical protein